MTGAEQAAGARAAQPTAAAKAEAWRLAVETDESPTGPARHLPRVLAARSGRGAAALRRALPRRRRGHLRAAGASGRQGRRTAEERAALAVPLADGQAGVPGPAGPLAGQERPLSDCGPPDRSTSDATTWCGRCAARPAGDAALQQTFEVTATRAVRRAGSAGLPGQADHRRRRGVRGGGRVGSATPGRSALPHGPGMVELVWTGRTLLATTRTARADRDEAAAVVAPAVRRRRARPRPSPPT